MGRRSFRGLPVASIGADDLGLGRLGHVQKTKAAALGELDAFVSHSWRDDGAKKYKGLRGWADAFEARESAPLIWLDKASIDQTDISTALACLVYLAGCRELLILAGPTYVERLWCVVEIFTYGWAANSTASRSSPSTRRRSRRLANSRPRTPSVIAPRTRRSCWARSRTASAHGAVQRLVRSTLSLQRRAEAVVEVAEEEADPDVVHMRGYEPPPDPTLECYEKRPEVPTPNLWVCDNF